MSGSGTDPFAPTAPGEDDDLQSELDAWDAKFDALHGTPEDAARQASGELRPPPVLSESDAELVPPAPTAARAPVAHDAFADDEPTRALHVPGALLDAISAPMDAVPAAPTALAHEAVTVPTVMKVPALAIPPELPPPPRSPDLDETDFSELGFDGSAASLGALLGPAGAPPAARRPAPPPPRTGFEEDEVFTAAIRPAAPGAGSSNPDLTRVAPAATYLFDGDQTEERAPIAGKAPASTARGERVARTGPAIVRRDRTTPQFDLGFDGGEATRVGDLSAIELLAATLDDIDLVEPPPAVDLDDEDEILPN